jgi:hypothetical protein
MEVTSYFAKDYCFSEQKPSMPIGFVDFLHDFGATSIGRRVFLFLEGSVSWQDVFKRGFFFL